SMREDGALLDCIVLAVSSTWVPAEYKPMSDYFDTNNWNYLYLKFVNISLGTFSAPKGIGKLKAFIDLVSETSLCRLSRAYQLSHYLCKLSNWKSKQLEESQSRWSILRFLQCIWTHR